MAPEPINLKGRIPELDGLRGVAIALVLVYHYFAGLARVSAPEGSLLAYASVPPRLAWSGVDLFFVLSGFLIGGILLDVRESPRYFKTFYARRFYRIVPLYFVMCVLALAGAHLLHLGERVAGLRLLFGNPVPWYVLATFTQNYWLSLNFDRSPFLGVTWSLAVEEQFYLTLPLLVRYVRRAWLPYVIGLVILSAPFFRLWVFYAHPEWKMAAYGFTPGRIDALLFGVAAAMLVRHARAWAWLVRRARALYFALGVLAAGMAVLTLTKADSRTLLLTFPGYSWVGLFYLCLLLVALTRRAPALNRALRARPLTGLGTVAYAAYLFHMPVLYACFGLVTGDKPRLNSPADGAVVLLALAVTLALSRLSWHYFERRLIRRGHRHVYGTEAAGAGDAPPRRRAEVEPPEALPQPLG